MSPIELQSGTDLVLKVNCGVVIQLRRTVINSALKGEVVLRAQDIGASGTVFNLVRLGLYGAGYGDARQISIGGISGTASLSDSSLEISFKAGITYRALELTQLPDTFSADHFRPRREIFTGLLRAHFIGSPSPEQAQFQLALLDLSVSEEELGLIRQMKTSPSLLSALPGILLRLDDVAGCPSALKALKSRISVRAVFFTDNNHNFSTGLNWPSQRDAAIRIWSKCCIEIHEALPPVVIPNGNLRVSTDLMSVASSHAGQPGVVHVFFIDQNFMGGGWTYGDGAAHARCVISDQIAGNTNVLAHEFGHVLDGDHPGITNIGSTFSWTGEPCTILQENGSTTVPNLENNTLHNCNSAKNDAIETVGVCCLNPDASNAQC